jgi:hypothetical protein
MTSYQVSEKLKEKCVHFLDEFLVNMEKCTTGLYDKVNDRAHKLQENRS